MISLLAAPSVCVIDDEPEEYEVILGALNKLFVPAHHINGADSGELPPEPFLSVRLVFQDLHLGGEGGKNAAARAANVFIKTVHPESAPVVVVIWSKHTDELVSISGEPEDDQPTMSDLFKQEVLNFDDRYKSRLIFIDMKKPHSGNRLDPKAWQEDLATEIKAKVTNAPATSLLWEWEQTVKTAAARVVQQLFSLSTPLNGGVNAQDDSMKLLLSRLASASSEGDLNELTAPRHIASSLSQLLSDQLDHNALSHSFLANGSWLGNQQSLDTSIAASLNGLLMTSESNVDGTTFAPGTVYRIHNQEVFTQLFDDTFVELRNDCFNSTPKSDIDKISKEKADPVFVELSPVCDVANSKRATATLVAGLIVPAALEKYLKKTGAFLTLPIFTLRVAGGELAANTQVILVISSKYRTTLPIKAENSCLTRWFRIRELPTAAIRTWLAGQIAKIGYVSL